MLACKSLKIACKPLESIKMVEDEKQNEDTLFDDENVSEELPQEEEAPQEDASEEEWAPTVSKESPKEKVERKGVKAEKDGATLTIKEVFFTRPKTKEQDGTPIPPRKTQTSGKPFYPGKLGIRFEEENLVEYYPTMRYFVNDGKMSTSAKLNRTGKSEIAKIFLNLVIRHGKVMV